MRANLRLRRDTLTITRSAGRLRTRRPAAAVSPSRGTAYDIKLCNQGFTCPCY